MIDGPTRPIHRPYLLVLDEAPFLGFLGGFDGEGLHVPLDWLDPAQWDTPVEGTEPADATAGTTVSTVLRAAQQVILHVHQGQSVTAALQAADINVQSYETVVPMLWRGVELASKAILPGPHASKLAPALAPDSSVLPRLCR